MSTTNAQILRGVASSFLFRRRRRTRMIACCRRRHCRMTRPLTLYCKNRSTPPSATSAVAFFSSSPYVDKREKAQSDIQKLAEHQASVRLDEFLLQQKRQSLGAHDAQATITTTSPMSNHGGPIPSQAEHAACLDAMLATFCLHTEARIASLLREGFYTIGPCGEETLAAAACALLPVDSLALHYRHLAINLARQLLQSANDDENDDARLQQLLLDRARGYVVSRNDPVTGGVHCAIGSAPSTAHLGGGGDFVVTSTLASQCPSAVGRALAYSLVRKLQLLPQTTDGNSNDSGCDEPERHDTRQQRPLSMVTIGDGSVHNHHFWSAFHLARHARHQNIHCPVLFGISDNGLSISYKTAGYVETLFQSDSVVPLFHVPQGGDLVQVYQQTQAAAAYCRTHQAPAVILYSNLSRRFGHAATDRQAAYLTPSEIEQLATSNALERCLQQAVEVYNVCTFPELSDRYQQIREWTLDSFAAASQEAKVTREDMLNRVQVPVAVSSLVMTSGSNSTSSSKETALIYRKNLVDQKDHGSVETPPSSPGRPAINKVVVMRKHMTAVLAETMQNNPSVVYLGEDVKHGGYYLVTDGLQDQFPGRVLDFPPDETSLLGAALGFAQSGLLPIVEIPYAKYLDCGADMFYEIAVQYWLTNGSELHHTNGMLIRLQGFDRGLFGGNFHTHNTLPHVPPGIDLVCYSNGQDYVKGFRNAMAKAAAGRVVMSVDCTHLLNLRHLHGSDRGWECQFPQDDETADSIMTFDQVCVYRSSNSSNADDDGVSAHHASACVVTYGNGVVTALQARRLLVETGALGSENELDVIDCPYLSAVPEGLRQAIAQYKAVLFADICKEGPGSGPLSSMVTALQQEGKLPHTWRLIAAPRTYNPLGSFCTFLNVDDIAEASREMVAECADT